MLNTTRLLPTQSGYAGQARNYADKLFAVRMFVLAVRMFAHNLSPRTWIFLSLGGFFLLALDQALKYFASSHKMFTRYLAQPWLGWEYFENSGIAFSLPIPNLFLILVTPLVLFALILYLPKQKHSLPALGLILIIAGAISNFIDRLLYGVTIDYIRVATGVFNLGDVMIVIGGILFIASKKHQPKLTA